MNDEYGHCMSCGQQVLTNHKCPASKPSSVSPPAQESPRLKALNDLSRAEMEEGIYERVPAPAQEVNVYRPSECYAVASGDAPAFVALSAYTSLSAQLEKVKQERDECERQFQQKVRDLGIEIDARQTAEQSLVATREALQLAQELFTHTNKQYRRFYWEKYKSEPTMEDGLYMRGEQMLKEMAALGDKGDTNESCQENS